MPVNVKSMKKVILIIVITAIVILGFLFFQKARGTEILLSQAEVDTSADSGPLFSFRGVLHGVLEEAKNIAAKVASPFAGSKTAPATQTDENGFSFAIIGDTQSFKSANPNGFFQTVVKDIAKDNPDLVIATGDLVGSSDNYSEYAKRFSDWKKIDAPLLSKTYAAMGNHDNINDKGVKAWQDAFNFPTNGPSGYSELTYSFDFKNSHFVVLASDSPDMHQIDGNQRAWLEKNLAAGKYENTFVFFHEPAFPVSSKVGESLDKYPSERDALWKIFEKYNVTAVFNGHEHIVSRRKVDGIYQFVFGSTESFDHDLPDPGVAEYANQGQGRFGIVSVNSKEITVKTYSSDNQELNSFTFSK
jgi:Icc protein